MSQQDNCFFEDTKEKMFDIFIANQIAMHWFVFLVFFTLLKLLMLFGCCVNSWVIFNLICYEKCIEGS